MERCYRIEGGSKKDGNSTRESMRSCRIDGGRSGGVAWVVVQLVRWVVVGVMRKEQRIVF